MSIRQRRLLCTVIDEAPRATGLAAADPSAAADRRNAQLFGRGFALLLGALFGFVIGAGLWTLVAALPMHLESTRAALRGFLLFVVPAGFGFVSARCVKHSRDV